MWAEAEEQPGDLYPRRQSSIRGRKDLMRPPSLYPQRVPPHLIVQQQQQQQQAPPPVGRGSPASRIRAEHSRSRSTAAAPSDDSTEESSSELRDGKEVRALQLALASIETQELTYLLMCSATIFYCYLSSLPLKEISTLIIKVNKLPHYEAERIKKNKHLSMC